MKIIPQALRAFLIVTGCCACLSACAPKALPPAEIADPRALLERIRLQSQPGKTLQAFASLRIDSPEGTYAAKAAVTAREPAFIRVETMPVFGTPDFFLTINNVHMKAFFVKQGKFYIGPPEKGITLFAPINMAPGEIVSLLKGSFPPHVLSTDIKIKAYLDGKDYKLDLFSAQARVRSLWVERSSGRLVKIEIPGRETYTAIFENFRNVEGSDLPGVIEIRSGEDRTVRIRYTELTMETGEPGESDPFDLEVPPGLEPSVLE